MADHEIKTIYKVEDQGTDELVRVSRGQQEVGDSAEKTAEQQGELGGELANVKSALLALGGAGGALAIANEAYETLRQRVAAANEELQRNAELARQAALESVNPLTLGLSREDIATAENIASAAGRDSSQGRRGITTIASRRGQLSTEEQLALLQASVDLGQFDPSTPLAAFIDPLLTVQNFLPDGDPTAASNIVNEAISQAGEIDPAKLSPLIAEFLPTGTGRIANLTVGQSAGAVGAATNFGIEGPKAVTSLRNLALILQGEGSPDAERIIEANNIRGDNLFEAIQNLSRANLSGQELLTIFGRENVNFAELVADPQTAREFIEKANIVGAVQFADRNLSVEGSERIAEEDPRVAIERVGRVAGFETKTARERDLTALAASSAREVVGLELQAARERGDVSPAMVSAIVPEGGDGIFDRLVAEGLSPAQAASLVERIALADALDFSPGVDIDLSSAVISQLGEDAFRRPGNEIRMGFASRANDLGLPAAAFRSTFTGPMGSEAIQLQQSAAEVRTEAERLGVNITNIGQQFNSTPPPGETDNGRRREGVAE